MAASRAVAKALAVALLYVVSCGQPAAVAAGDDAVLLDGRRYPIVAGRFSAFADFQVRLRSAVGACRGEVPAPVTPETMGRIGPETVSAIQAFAECRGETAFPEASPARAGVLTLGVWRAVMGELPPPDPMARAHAMVLSFEGTDFGDLPEWNLCQDGFKMGRRGPVACYNSSDPCSYLTWGPRGATAGSGREIQYILADLERADPELLKRAFGAEYATLSRFFRAKPGPRDSCVGQIPLKVLVCSIWATPERRHTWESALKQLGADPRVREIYDRLYAADEFDGGKMRAFFALWNALGLPPSEVDIAFFLDRITHLGGPPNEGAVAKMQACVRDEKAISRHGAARRCLSRLQTHATQPDYRTGRDVAYYLDAYNEGVISEREIKLWADYMPISAVHNFGLRDDVAVALPPTRTLRALGMELPPTADGQVLPAEAARCPAIVLTPRPAP